MAAKRITLTEEQKASENIDDVSAYVIRKLKIKYGNR